MSCGLKNSGCSDPTVSAPPAVGPQRFYFVDNSTGLWTTGRTYNSIINCPVGSFVVFYYPSGTHDVYELSSAGDYETCNFTNATLVSPRELSNVDTSLTGVDYYFNCSEPNKTTYLACSVPGHCENGQRIQIHTSDTNYAYNQSTATWNLPVNSFSRLLVLLGYRQNPVTGIFDMDRGFQTEALANVTTELILSGLESCPQTSQDFINGSSLSDCQSLLYTLLGYVTRRRPIPQYDKAEEYYKEAIKRHGPNECAARSYYCQLYMSSGEYDEARDELIDLCRICNSNSGDQLTIQQARRTYDQLDLTSSQLAWPDQCLSTATESTGGSSATNLLHSSTWINGLCALFCMLILMRR